MKVTEEFIASLKKCYEINQSLRLVHGATEIRTCSENSTMLLIINEQYDVPRDVNLYDLREFISVLSLVEDPVIDLSKDNIVTIKSADGKQVLKYTECEPDFVSSYSDKTPQLKRQETIINVSAAQFKSVVSAAQTMKLPFIGFSGDGDTVELVTFDKNDGDDKDTNSYSVNVGESDTDQTFKMYFNLNVNSPAVLVGEGDLIFSICSSPKLAKVNTTSGKEFYLAFDIKSSFGE